MVLFADFDPLVGILAATERKQPHLMEVFHGGDLLSPPPQQTFSLQVGQLAALNRLNSSPCCWQAAAAIISEDD